MKHEMLHTCPRCSNTKISELAAVYCDDCSGRDNSIMRMKMGGEVFYMEMRIQDDSLRLW